MSQLATTDAASCRVGDVYEVRYAGESRVRVRVTVRVRVRVSNDALKEDVHPDLRKLLTDLDAE